MTHTNHSTTQPAYPGSPTRPMILGAGFALLIVSLFVFTVSNPSPEWGKFWIIRPLIITPLAGAGGGALYYLLYRLHYRNQLNRNVAILLGLLVYLFCLWLGTILGLAGTLWD